MTREDKLQRLRVASPCENLWETMEGDARRRHCLQCEKQVYDFAQLTPREIAGLLEASRGHLCGRLTRDGAGRLVTLAPPAAAPRPVPGRVSPLAATVVTALLGVSGAAWADQTTPVSPTVEQGAGERSAGEAGNRPQRAGDAGSSLSGKLTNEQGEPVPNAEVRIVNLLDLKERTGRTDADGRFSFAALQAGIYELSASVRGHHAAEQSDLFLFTGEQRQVGLTVSSEAWQRILANDQFESMTIGVLISVAEPMRQVYAHASLVVLAVAGKSVVLEEGDYTLEVRTDLVISSVLKGRVRERVIAVFHDQMSDEDPMGRLQPGDTVLAFLDPQEAEDGRGAAGWVVSDETSGLRTLSEHEVGAYRDRLEALARITRNGEAHPEDLMEWLVVTAEDPATRKEVLRELSGAVWQLKEWAERSEIPIDHYAQDLRGVIADFLAAGGKLVGGADDLILASHLTDAHRGRLTKALLRTRDLKDADLDLFHLVSGWHDDRLLPWLAERLQTPGAEAGVSRSMIMTLADALADERLTKLQEAGEEVIGEIEDELYDASGDAERKRLEARLAAAEEELRRRFVEALQRQDRR